MENVRGMTKDKLINMVEVLQKANNDLRDKMIKNNRKINVNRWTISEANREEIVKAYLVLEQAICNKGAWKTAEIEDDRVADLDRFIDDEYAYDDFYNNVCEELGYWPSNPFEEMDDETEVPTVEQVAVDLKSVRQARLCNPFSDALRRLEGDLEYGLKDYLELN